jgi:SAM-dependent methyltransferase
MTDTVRHLPYEINPEKNRFHYYETLWKHVGVDLLKKHYRTEGKSLLDYGCGRGETMELAAREGMKPTGTDLDPECVRLASKFGTSCMLNADDPLTQFGPKSFDVITCFHVLEHVPNPRETLQALGQIARDYVVLAVPNLRFLYWTFKRQFDVNMVNEGHLQGWDHWHFRNLAERHCGLELIEWGTDATILPMSGLMLRLMGPKMTIKLETGPFRKLFPYHGISVLGLFKPRR